MVNRRMDVGQVFSIRLNPEDIMGAIDVVKQAGIATDRMSLAMVVKLALAGFLEKARQQGIIPVRDGFEFLEMTEPFGGSHQQNKLAFTANIKSAEYAARTADVPVMRIPINPAATASRPEQAITALDRKKGRVLTRIMELDSKMQADPDNFSEQERTQLATLQGVYDQLVEGIDVEVQLT